MDPSSEPPPVSARRSRTLRSFARNTQRMDLVTTSETGPSRIDQESDDEHWPSSPLAPLTSQFDDIDLSIVQEIPSKVPGKFREEFHEEFPEEDSEELQEARLQPTSSRRRAGEGGQPFARITTGDGPTSGPGRLKSWPRTRTPIPFRVYATSISDVFPKPGNTGEVKTFVICHRCKQLGREQRVLYKMSIEAFTNCRNCQFMLDCLRRAPFMDERRQMKIMPNPSSTTRQYQLSLSYNSTQAEYVLRLDSVYAPNEIAVLDKAKELDIGDFDSDDWARNSQPFDPYCVSSYFLASCPLVISNGYSNAIDKDPRPKESVRVVSQWLEKCQSHENCPSQTNVPLPTRVIKIPSIPGTNPSLWTTSGSSGKYVALSHCWGMSVPVTTTLDTLIAHQSQIILSDLPRSFRDAIDIAQMLGFTYLWIDSLCIIQDSVEDWANECSKMASVYANATLVVGAAAAEDSTRGFLNSRSFHQGPMLDEWGRVFLREKVTSRKAQATSPLASRAWAYQEALLAPRLLLYTESQMSWECRQGIKDEGVNVVVSSNNSCSKKQFYRTIDSPLLPPKVSADTEASQSMEANQSFIENACNRLNTWCGCIEDYSHRQLTQASDKLPALSGLASAIHDHALGEYLAGIWSKDLATGLFWSRHTAREELYDRPFKKCLKYRAPSWSWASHDGPVNFRADSNVSSRPALASDIGFNTSSYEAQYAPKLIGHKMLLATSDKYGQVLEGSYITLEGQWTRIYPYNPIPQSAYRPSVQTRGYLPSSHRTPVLENESFTIRRDHAGGVQERYTWYGTSATPESRVLLRLSSTRCLILSAIGPCWERSGCCILPSERRLSSAREAYSPDWQTGQFTLI